MYSILMFIVIQYNNIWNPRSSMNVYNMLQSLLNLTLRVVQTLEMFEHIEHVKHCNFEPLMQWLRNESKNQFLPSNCTNDECLGTLNYF